MPRYLSVIYHDEPNLPTEPPSEELQQRMGELYEAATKAGIVVDMAELARTSEATRLDWSDNQLTMTDGPFTESKEVIGGYTIVQTKDQAEAVEWARRFIEIQGQHESRIRVEVRRIAED